MASPCLFSRAGLLAGPSACCLALWGLRCAPCLPGGVLLSLVAAAPGLLGVAFFLFISDASISSTESLPLVLSSSLEISITGARNPVRV
jgi:hypothetical protein